MLRKALFLCLVGCLLAIPLSWGIQPQYTSAKLTHVERKTRERVDLYLVNTPVSSEVPYFEIIVQLNQTDYTAQFTPRHPKEELPSEWVAGADVRVRLEKHALFLKRPDGTELRWTVVKKVPVKEVHDREQ
jgi:hypothetical protein